MDRSPSRLRSAGGSVASGSSIPTSSESQYDGRGSLVGRSTRATDHARDQVQSALDGLLSDDDPSNPRSPPGRYAPSMDGTRSPGQPEAQGRRSLVPPDPIIPTEASYPRSGRSSTDLLSPARKASSVRAAADGGGYTPTGAGGRRYAWAKKLKFWLRGLSGVIEVFLVFLRIPARFARCSNFRAQPVARILPLRVLPLLGLAGADQFRLAFNSQKPSPAKKNCSWTT